MHGRPRGGTKPRGPKTNVQLPEGGRLLEELTRLCDADPLIDEFGILPTPEIAAAVLAGASGEGTLNPSEFPGVFVLCEHKLGVLAAALKPLYLAADERIIKRRHADTDSPAADAVAQAKELLSASLGILLLVRAHVLHALNLSHVAARVTVPPSSPSSPAGRGTSHRLERPEKGSPRPPRRRLRRPCAASLRNRLPCRATSCRGARDEAEETARFPQLPREAQLFAERRSCSSQALLALHPKSQAAWAHRRWVLQQQGLPVSPSRFSPAPARPAAAGPPSAAAAAAPATRGSGGEAASELVSGRMPLERESAAGVASGSGREAWWEKEWQARHRSA